MTFNTVNATPRTNKSFRGRDCVEHHTGTSPLEKNYRYNMVKGVPPSDRLHLIDEVVSKKIDEGIIHNKFGDIHFVVWSLDKSFLLLL